MKTQRDYQKQIRELKQDRDYWEAAFKQCVDDKEDVLREARKNHNALTEKLRDQALTEEHLRDEMKYLHECNRSLQQQITGKNLIIDTYERALVIMGGNQKVVTEQMSSVRIFTYEPTKTLTASEILKNNGCDKV